MASLGVLDIPNFSPMAETEKWKRVGERVGALIRIRGYKTIELFAHENGVDKSVLNRLIRGKREVRLSTFLKILDALEITIAELYAGGGSLTRDKDSSSEGRASRAKQPEAGGRTFKFTRDEFDRIEVRKTSRDKSPVTLECSGKKTRALALQAKTFRMEL
jgi:transcriptional regulator with XRE-family HTH domain